jgi:ABC-2 type transport system permease protein
LNAYLYKAKMKMLVSISYKFEVFATIITRFVLMMTSIFLWQCVYKGRSTIDGLAQNQMITYSILSICLAAFFRCGVQDTISRGVRNGNIAIDFLRPYQLLGAFFAEDIGEIIISVFNRALPLLLLGWLFFGLDAPVGGLPFLLFLSSAVLGLLILWFLSALIGMFSFWTMELGNMGVVKDTIVSILSGSMIPIWFFPEGVQKVLAYLPFQYTYQTPLGLYIGKITVAEGFRQMLIQLVWIVILGSLTILAWNHAKRNVMIQGG